MLNNSSCCSDDGNSIGSGGWVSASNGSEGLGLSPVMQQIALTLVGTKGLRSTVSSQLKSRAAYYLLKVGKKKKGQNI